MPRAARLLPLAIILIAGVVLLFRDGDGSGELSASITPVAPEPVQSVEVERILVTAEVVSAADALRPPDRVPAAKPAAASRHTAVAEAATPRDRPTSLAAKTRRAILGDGRHKPQPFPRINNN